MNLTHLALLITAAGIANAASLSSTSSIQSSNHDDVLKSQQPVQSLTQSREIQSVAPERPASLNIFLPLNPEKWVNTPHAKLTIARLVPTGKAAKELGERELGRLVGKIKKAIKRWSAVCNKTSLLYTAILDPSHDSILAQDEGIIAFTGPIVGVLNTSMTRLPSICQGDGHWTRKCMAGHPL